MVLTFILWQLVLIYDLYTAYSAMYIYAGNSNSQP